MKMLIEFHLHYLMSKKTRLFLLGLVCVMALVLVFLTRWFDGYVDRVMFRNDYARDFRMESFGFLKLTMMVLMVFLCIQLWFVSAYDIVLLQRVSRIKLYLSKFLVMMIVVIIIILMSVMMVIGLDTLSNFQTGGMYYLKTGIYLTVFTLFYGALLTMLALLWHHLSVCFICLIGFFISDILVAYEMSLDSVSVGIRLYHMIFLNVHIFSNDTFSFITNLWYVPAVILVLTVFSMGLIKHKDF